MNSYDLFIIDKKPKTTLRECLEDYSLEELKYVLNNLSNDDKRDFGDRKDYINYLIEVIPVKFRSFLETNLPYSIFYYLNTLTHDSYIPRLIKNGFTFRYSNENNDNFNVFPQELKSIFNQYFSEKRIQEYRLEKIIKYIEYYLQACGRIPCSTLKKLVLKDKFLNVSENEYKNAIKVAKIRKEKEFFTIIDINTALNIEENKVFSKYKFIDFQDMEIYADYLNDFLDEIFSILKIKKNDVFARINILNTICFSYKQANNYHNYLKKWYKLDEEVTNQLQDIMYKYKYDYLRYWNMGGSTWEEYHTNVYLNTSTLEKKPSKTDTLSCLELLSPKSIEMITNYYKDEYGNKSNLEELKDTILDFMKNELRNRYEDDYLKSFVFEQNLEFSSEIESSLLYAGFVFLYRDKDKISVLPTDEFVSFIKEEIIGIDYFGETDIYIYYYVKINGLLEISKLQELMLDYHNIKISRKEIIEKAIKMKYIILDSRYITIYSDFETNDVKRFIGLKNSFGKYRKVDIDEIAKELQFIEEIDNCLLKVKDVYKKEILNDLQAMLTTGIYSKENLRITLKENHATIYYDKLNKICQNYKNKVPITIRNGYHMQNIEIKKSTSKIGRNDPCPCGSGKKYKQCCGK